MKRYQQLPAAVMLACALFVGGCASETETESSDSGAAISGSIRDAKSQKLRDAYLAADADDFVPLTQGIYSDEELKSLFSVAEDAHWYTWNVDGHAYISLDFLTSVEEGLPPESFVVLFQLFEHGAPLVAPEGSVIAVKRVEEGKGTISAGTSLYFIPRLGTWIDGPRGELPTSVPAELVQ